jgi:hypothetical protein
MKTIELKSTIQLIKILTIVTLTYLIFSLSNNIQRVNMSTIPDSTNDTVGNWINGK